MPSTPNCTILNYGMGNLRSVQKALEAVGAQATITADPADIAKADRLILPGVGAFGDGMDHLEAQKMVAPIKAYAESGRPMLGICLGMQLMLTSSTEHGQDHDGPVAGLDLIPGSVVRFQEDQGVDRPRLKVPHMGWNAINFEPGTALFAGLESGEAHVYFVHAYHARVQEKNHIAATCDYGQPFCAAVHKDNLWATQFHPEKSQAVGLTILKNFLAL